jgi:carbamoyl-phosphate synthase small subunit
LKVGITYNLKKDFTRQENQPTDLLEEFDVPGIMGVDTRALTIKTRISGTLRAALLVGSDDGSAAVELARKTPDISKITPIPQVSCKKPYRIEGNGKRIAVIDLGIKKNMLTSLRAEVGISGCFLTTQRLMNSWPAGLW